MYKKSPFIIRFQKKISPQVGLEPTKWDKAWRNLWSWKGVRTKIGFRHFNTQITYLSVNIYYAQIGNQFIIQIFLKTLLPKKRTKYWTKFCPMKLGQTFVKYFVHVLGNWLSSKNAFEIYRPSIGTVRC